jgi:hypothetical protein
MSITGISYWVLASVIVLASAGCATDATMTTSPMSIPQAREQLNADIRACTQRYDYHPDKLPGLSENALAPSELQWRDCAYAALRAYAKANPAMASQYDSLITSDVAMTKAVQQGTMTRSQRKARIEQQIAEIKSAEDHLIMTTQLQQQQQLQGMENTIGAIRALGR